MRCSVSVCPADGDGLLERALLWALLQRFTHIQLLGRRTADCQQIFCMGIA
jgi:hypothetical protein